MAHLIETRDVWKDYHRNGGETISALRGVNLTVDRGEVLLMLGKSGSGKTTLLNLLAGLDRPTRGSLQIDGRELMSIGEKARTLWRRKHLGFIFQFFNLLPTLTAFENVFLSLELAGNPDRNRAIEALQAVGLGDRGDSFPHELSGGEQQRVAVARAMVKNPRLILADEPTGNLDTKTGDEVLGLLIERCRRSSTTLLMASHAIQRSKSADRILRMSDGIIREDTTPP